MSETEFKWPIGAVASRGYGAPVVAARCPRWTPLWPHSVHDRKPPHPGHSCGGFASCRNSRSAFDIANFQHVYGSRVSVAGTFRCFSSQTVRFAGVPTMQIAQRLGRLAWHGLILSGVLLG